VKINGVYYHDVLLTQKLLPVIRQIFGNEFVFQELLGWAAAPPSPLLAVPNLTAHPSTASVPTSYYSMRHYNYMCPLKG